MDLVYNRTLDITLTSCGYSEETSGGPTSWQKKIRGGPSFILSQEDHWIIRAIPMSLRDDQLD